MGKYAVILVSAILFSMIAYSHGLLNIFLSSEKRTVESYSYHQAHNIAQSALMVAITDIMDNHESDFVPLADSSVAYPSATTFQEWAQMEGFYRLLFHNQGDSLLAIQSTGRFQEKEVTSSAGLVFIKDQLFQWPPMNQAVHAEGNITLTGSSRFIGNVTTNSTDPNAVSFGWSTYIDGDLYVGPDGETDVVAPTVQPGNITGDTGTLSEEQEFDMPEFPPSPGTVPVSQSLSVTTWEEEQAQNLFHYSQFEGVLLESLAIAGNRTMTLDIGAQDRVLHVRNIDIPQGHLNIIGEGTLTIYVEDGITLGGGSTVNQQGDPEKLMINYAGSEEMIFGGDIRLNSNLFIKEADLTIDGSNQIKGNIISGGENITVSGNAGNYSRAVYAPNADVVLAGSGRIFGSVISNSITAMGDSFVEFQPDFEIDLPDLQGGESSSDGNFYLTYWN